MVWGLFPVDPLPGEDTYYFFAQATYKVGRKGCDVIINKDKGVSRVHAEIIIDAMASRKPLRNKSSSSSSRVRIRDCSKYGTFVNRNFGSKEKIHELPNKEINMNDGDIVSFGTGNATYRFCFVPMILFVRQEFVTHYLREKVSSIGACIAHDFNLECTHVLVDQSMPLKEDLIDAIVAKKPFAHNSWLEVLSEKNIRTEIPSCTPYAPTLTLEGVSVKVADPKIREGCMQGYKYIMDSPHVYKFGDQLLSLLEVAGALVLSFEAFCASDQGSEKGKNYVVVCVITGGSANNEAHFHRLSSLSRVKEDDLVISVVSGHIDPSILIPPSVLISSSCSTDETVVADTDEEVETATSNRENSVVGIDEVTKHESETEIIPDHASTLSENPPISNFQDKNVGGVVKTEDSDSEKGDVICCQLIVRNMNSPSKISIANNQGVPNFKRFSKIHTHSGNSFSSLIPYSKYPYRDSDGGNAEVVESVKEEKKRKQIEAVAEDLFNNEKARKRGSAGSVYGLLSRG